ncbi:MAG: dihydroorotate dehydrogenase electron transfer subunit [Planctomycetaceae bacterium]|nr:dihydroorotate dehydrogenase electron transfer subunit [Planctomycetaceae bacterium]
MFHRTARVIEHVKLAERTHRVRLECPEIAAAIRPGQFVMLRLPGTTDPLLGRPFALYDTVLDASNKPIGLDVVYLVVGKMTGRLQSVEAGKSLEVWGPLGKPFLDVGTPEQVTFVAGGIGQTPFLAFARELLGTRGFGGDAPRKRTDTVSLYYGVRSASLAAGVDDFRAAGVEVHLASDDGSIGTKGFVTQLLASHGKTGPLVGCGPEPMLHALAKVASAWGVSCQVSLETPMACGVGICFSCVAKVNTPDGWDYKRVCMDGPAFDASQLVWG